MIYGSEDDKLKRLSYYEENGGWVLQDKSDGINGTIINVNNNQHYLSKNNKEKKLNIPNIGDGTVLMGEFGISTEKAIERRKLIGHDFVDLFDILFYKYKDLRNLTLIERYKYLLEFYNSLSLDNKEYFNILELKYNNFKENYISNYEGVILKNVNGIYNSFDFDWIKVKKELDCDFVVMGYEVSKAESKREIKTASSIIGGQFVNDSLKEMVKVPIPINIGIDIVNDYKKYENKVICVGGNIRFKSGSIRHPKFLRFRDDVNYKEVIFKK